MSSGVSVCMVNYNGEELLRKYLPRVVESLNSEEDLVWELVFFDNGSDDDSVNAVRAICPSARILCSKDNLGFSRSNNIAVGFTDYQNILLLNNDVVPENGFLKPLLDRLDDDNVFAVAPKMYRPDKKLDDGIRNAEFRTGLLTPVLDVEKSMRNNADLTTFFCGGAVLLKKELFDKLNGFDLIYNPYSWEDLDLSYRAWKYGYQVVYEPSSVVYHLRETTAKKVYSPSYLKMIVWRNRFIFMWKNLSFRPGLLEHIFYLPSKLVKFICTGRGLYVIGFFWALIHLPKVLIGRVKEQKNFVRTDNEVFKLAGGL